MECEVAGTRHQDCSDLPFRMPLFGEDHGYEGVGRFYRLFDLKLALIDAFFEATEGRRRLRRASRRRRQLSLARTTEMRFGSSVRRRDEGVNGKVEESFIGYSGERT